jgi:integrase
MPSKHAKVLDARDFADVMAHVAAGEHSLRDQAMLLLSHKAGLRAQEIAWLQWKDVTDARGKVRDDFLYVPANITKNACEASLPMHPQLLIVLTALRAANPDATYVIYGLYNRKKPMNPNAVAMWFSRTYAACHLKGCSSHSGRRTFITTLARKANMHDCSMLDVRMLARHASMATTQLYIEPSANVGRLIGAI